jgi:hypothetical protein
MRMRVSLAVAGVVILFGMAVPQAVAQSVGEDSVVGSAEDCDGVVGGEVGGTPCGLGTPLVHVDVRGGPGGEDATGSVSFGTRFGFGQYGVATEPSCLAVSGNVAVIGFAGTRRSPSFGDLPVVGFLQISDGGAGVGQDSFRWTLEPSTAPGPTVCPATPPGGLPTLGGSGVNDRGDLVVHDAARLPASTAECKNGGWRTYGVFKNQGDCVSFAATKGNNLPASSP